MKVCFLQATFHPFVGGTERQSLQLAQRLIKKGVQVEVVTACFKGLKSYEVVQGVPVHRVWVYDSGSKRSFLQTLTWVFSAVFYLFQSKPFDVYHAHQALSPAFIASIVSKIKGKKSLSKVANTGSAGEMHALNQGILGKLLRSFVLSVDGFIATSLKAKEELAQNQVPPSKVFEVPNGVDTDTFKPVMDKAGLRKKLGLPLNKKILLYVAKSEEQKALPWLVFLLRTWRGVQVKNAQLIVLGKKEFLPKLPLNLQKVPSFEIQGIQPNPEEYMQASDAFVLPSSAEGLSNVLLEAMSTGLPVVATRVSGSEDLIQDGKNGLLVPPNNVQALEKALGRVLAKPDPMWGKEARKAILEKYSFEQIVQQYMKLYKKLVRG